MEVESSLDGVMFRHLAAEEAELPVNTPIAVVSAAGETPSDDEIDALVVQAGGKPSKKVEKPAEQKKEEKAVPVAEKTTESDDNADAKPAGGVRSSPLARKIAEDHNIQLAAVEGSGPSGAGGEEGRRSLSWR